MGEVVSVLDASGARDLLARIATNVGRVMCGHAAATRKLLAAIAAGGHVLLEDTPGTGKTTLAKAIAQSTGLRFSRVQFTPDLLPSDIVGVSVFNPRTQGFDFHEGPVFTHLLLADEVNRASPRTQSALLEVMAEGQVTVEGRTHRMDDPFFVIATQNPVEFRGTYPLPEAQMDRFALRLKLGHVDADTEVAVLTAQEHAHPLASLQACASTAEIVALKVAVREVRISAEVKRYVVDLVRATRAAPGVILGCGPRASLALMASAKALALFDSEGYVRPEHVQELALDVLAHRIALDPQAKYGGTTAESVVAGIVQATPVPA